MKQKINLHIMMGLPGSGKSTFAKQLEKSIGRFKCYYIDMDKLKEEVYFTDKSDTYTLFNRKVSRTDNSRTDIIVDGLILTNSDIIKVIDIVSNYTKEIKVKLYWWKEDRETCIKNDGGRRNTSSANTILNAKYEKVDVDYICNELCDCNITLFKVITKTIFLKNGWERHFRHIAKVNDDFKIRSERWCTGGAYGNCWNDSLSTVGSDEPVEFCELDNLLETICPNITFLHYKKITKECVDIEDEYEPDYYGGGCHYANWVCDLQSLYGILEELGYINEDNT